MANIRDVAALAQVSPITVSRVLNNPEAVSPETRARVRAAIDELGYIPNQIARSLRSNRTNTLALVLTDITNPFWTTVARSVEDTASAPVASNVILCNTDEREDKQTSIFCPAAQTGGRFSLFARANPTLWNLSSARSAGGGDGPTCPA